MVMTLCGSKCGIMETMFLSDLLQLGKFFEIKLGLTFLYDFYVFLKIILSHCKSTSKAFDLSTLLQLTNTLHFIMHCHN